MGPNSLPWAPDSLQDQRSLSSSDSAILIRSRRIGGRFAARSLRNSLAGGVMPEDQRASGEGPCDQILVRIGHDAIACRL